MIGEPVGTAFWVFMGISFTIGLIWGLGLGG